MNGHSLPRPSEFDLIARHFAPLAPPTAFGLLDDAALLRVPAGQELVVTKDALVAGVHFFPDDPPGAIAAKALRVNLSDLAAKGAVPAGFLLGLALPADWRADWLEAFAAGLAAEVARYGCPLYGGDTVRAAGGLTLSITAFGLVPAGAMVPRAGARPLDRLVVTGSIGDAALGLQLRLGRLDALSPALAPDHRAHLTDRYLLPQPRTALAEGLRRHAHAAMDISDGFVGDLTKLVALAGLGAVVQVDEVPLSVAVRGALRADASLLESALTGGDDYEILAAVPAASLPGLQAAADAAGIPLQVVGTCTDRGLPLRFVQDGRDVTFGRGSYVHF
jgi:thiamine-monophosphate kinase